MTSTQKNFVKLMMTPGHYALPRQARGVQKLAIYKGNQVLVRQFIIGTVKEFRELFKKDRAGRMTINLTKVRQLHGKSWVKKQYKIKKRLQENQCAPCEYFK
jgi:hypothetical protein